jgi:hypothetical protein
LKVLDTLEKNLSAPSRCVISRSRQLCRSCWPWSPSEEIIDGEDVLVLQLVLGDTESADPMIMRTESAHLGVKDDLEPRRESSFSESERSSTCSPSSSSLKIIALFLSSLGVDQTTIPVRHLTYHATENRSSTSFLTCCTTSILLQLGPLPECGLFTWVLSMFTLRAAAILHNNNGSRVVIQKG